MNKMAHTYFSGLALGSFNPPLFFLDMSTIINKIRQIIKLCGSLYLSPNGAALYPNTVSRRR